MLIRFNVKNFLSFSSRDDGQSQEFSMISGKVRNKKTLVIEEDKLKLLKFAAVYGANAAGKSNLVKAIQCMRTLVVNGFPKGSSAWYCKNDSENRGKASYFETEILLNHRYYAYGFEVILSTQQFVSEWLVELMPDNREKVIFERDLMNKTYSFAKEFQADGLYDKLRVYADDISDDHSVLMLSVLNKHKRGLYHQFKEAMIFAEMYQWFEQRLDINFPDQPISDYSYMVQTENVEKICRFISAFGTGITDFQLVEVPVEKVFDEIPKSIRSELLTTLEKKAAEMNANPDESQWGLVMRSRHDFFTLEFNQEGEILCKTIQFSHGSKKTLFSLSEESDGTIRILDLLEILLSEEGKVYIVDELDRCLHPTLSYQFVKTYLQLAAEKKIQLIVTTHESRLLDFDLLRRDEVWFIDKKNSGDSDIYSLEEYNTRFDQKVDKAYLEGRYGGVPIFSTVFPVTEK